jgi:ADP-heptose:LPS heptosyltransferase
VDIIKGHPLLDQKTYDIFHKNLFHSKLQSRDVVSLEPYRVWEYYNQKCNLTQAFDILINNKGIRKLPKPTVILSKEETVQGKKLIDDIKTKIKKDKTIIFQPFGRGIEHIDSSFIDKTGRSIEYKNIKSLIRKLQKENFAVILMSEFGLDLKDQKYTDEVAFPEGLNLRQWASVIKHTDHFFGCDSVGQHLSYAMQTPTTVVLGPTYPVNTSYPDCEYFNIMDLGEIDREYDPIRITMDERITRKNELLMAMNEQIEDFVVNGIMGRNKDD